MASQANVFEEQVNLLIAEMDEALETFSEKQIESYLESHSVAGATADAIRHHFQIANELSHELARDSTDPPDQIPSEKTIGPYRLVRQLGEGGMGTVWLAEQFSPIKRQVAIKLMRPGLESDQLLRRFEMERQALAVMDHPNVAKVLDAGSTKQNAPYFVMEYLKGSILTSYCDEANLTPKERLSLFLELCDAIQHAHQKGVIHRDIKPSNALVCEVDGKPVVKVIDFGLARAAEHQQSLVQEPMTQMGAVLGSFPYMSPEQARGAKNDNLEDDIDTRTDVYSLGAVLYELLTGTTPIPTEKIKKAGTVETLRMIQEDEPERPSVRLKRIGDESAEHRSRQSHPSALRILVGDLDWIVMKSLEIDRSRRYEAVSGLAQDIARFLHDEPVTARPPSRGYVLRKFGRKHRVAVFSSSLILLALVVGFAFAASAAYQTGVANRKLERTVEDLDDALAREEGLRREQVVEQIEVLVGRGQWDDAMKQIQRFEWEKDDKSSIRVKLARLDALDGLQRTEQLKDEILKLANEDLNEEQKAQYEVWRAYSFLLDGTDTENPGELLRSAIASGKLKDAERAFAEGLAAESMAESVKFYEEALQHSSFHIRARLQLVVSLVLLGRRDEVVHSVDAAIQIFPNDLRFYLARAYSEALSGDRRATQRTIQRINERFPGTNTEYIITALRTAEDLDQTIATFENTRPIDWFEFVSRSIQTMSSEDLMSIPAADYQKPQVFDAFFEYVKTIMHPSFIFGEENAKLEMIINASDRAAEIHPDSFFLLMKGMSIFAPGKFAEAEKAFIEVYRADSMFPFVRREGYFFAFASRVGTWTETQDESDFAQALYYLDQYPKEYIQGFRVTMALDAYVLANRWADARDLVEARTRTVGDRRHWMGLLLNSAVEHENWGIALSTCDEMLSLEPSDNELLNRRAEILEAINATASDD